MPLLADIYSIGNTFKRRMRDFAADPGAFLETELAYRNQKAGEFNTLTTLATQGEVNKAKGLPVSPEQQAAQTSLQDILMGAYNPMGLTVYHGSRHLFPRFDLKKIGTGEGNQSYGVGAGYTAEARPVAETYKRMEAEYQKMTGGMQPDVEYAYDLVTKGLTEPQIIDNFAYKYGSQMNFDQAMKAIKTAKQYANEGYLYKGDIPDEIIPKFLDYDKPLKDQSPEVQSLAKSLGMDLEDLGGDLLAKVGKNFKGTQTMYDSGIRGVRYLDQGSRGEGKGTSNFVPFSPEDFKIQEINDIPIQSWVQSGKLKVEPNDPLMQFLGYK